MRKCVSRFCLLSLIYFFLAFTSFTFANGAKPIENPTDQSIIFDDNSGISLIRETVDFHLFTTNRPYEARVYLEYTLKNTTDAPQKFKMFFLTPNMMASEFQAEVNGQLLTLGETQNNTKPPNNWRASRRLRAIDPISKKPLEYEPSNWNSMEPFVGGTLIPLNFQPGETLELKMSYLSSGGYIRNIVVEEVYSQLYYLTPASFWEGDTDLHLKITLPAKSRKIHLHSNIPMKQDSPNTYSVSLSKIPEDEWLFSYLNATGSRAILGTNDVSTHNKYVLLITLFLIVLASILRRKYGVRYRKLYIIIYILAVSFLLLLFSHSGYFIFFALFFFLPIIAGVFILYFIIDKIYNYLDYK